VCAQGKPRESNPASISIFGDGRSRGTVSQEDPQEYEAKARFLATTPESVEWPPSTFKTPAAPLQICVHGNPIWHKPRRTYEERYSERPSRGR
jgi:hypothetical protein